MYDTSDLRKGLKVVIDGAPYIVIEAQFVKPGKGQAFTRTKLRNMITGTGLERTYRSGEKLEPADIDERHMQYLYTEGDRWVFMDTKTYDQVAVDEEQMQGNQHYMLEATEVDMLLYAGRVIGITPPTFVELTVVETEPGFRGDTTSNVTKPAKLDTGLTVQVPPFVDSGEKLKIDTRTGEYVERVKK